MKALLVKIAVELVKSGIPTASAERIACSVVIDGLVKAGMDLAEATDKVIGVGFWDGVKNEI